MQIFEVTANEGILKGIAGAAGGALTRAAHNYFGTTPTVNPYIDRTAEIRKTLQPLTAGLAQTQFKNWNAALANYGVDSPTKLDATAQQALKSAILKNASKTFDVSDLLKFSNYIEPAYRQQAAKTEQNIADIVDTLMSKPGQQTQQDWTNFVTNGQEASMLIKMHSGYSSAQVQDVTFDGKNYFTANRQLDPNNANDEKIIQQAMKYKRFSNKSAGSPASATPTAASNASTDSTIKVNTGKRIKVQLPVNNAIYYKTAAGWTNELGQKIQDSNSISRLEQYADAGFGREETIPTARTQTPAKATAKRRKGKKRVR